MNDHEQTKWKMAGAALLWLAQLFYVVLPFDLLPDFIPIIGWIDDLVAVFGLIVTSIGIVQTAKEMNLFGLLDSQTNETSTNDYEPIPDDVLRAL